MKKGLFCLNFVSVMGLRMVKNIVTFPLSSVMSAA